MAIAIKMPKLSPTMETGVLSSWLVEVGKQIKAGDVIAEIETDKAIMEIEALENGVIGYIADVVKKDTPVNCVIGYILAPGEKAPDSWETLLAKDNASFLKQNENTPAMEKSEQEVQKEEKLQSDESANMQSSRRVYASPLAKKIANQKGIDIASVHGSGPKGRVIKRDLENIDSLVQKTIKLASAEKSYEIPMTNMRKRILHKHNRKNR